MLKLFQQGFAPFIDVTVGNVKAVAVPGVCYVSASFGIIQQFVDLMLRVRPQNTHHIADVVSIHPDQIIIPLIVAFLQLYRVPVRAGDAVFQQFFLGRRVDWVANAVSYFFPAGRTGSDFKFLCPARFLNQVF